MSNKLGLLWQRTRGERGRYAAAAGAMALSILAVYATPLIMRAAIDGILGGSNERMASGLQPLFNALGENASIGTKLALAASVLALLTIASGLFSYLRGRLSAVAAERIIRKLREELYDHLQHLPCAYHDKAQTGDLVQRCTSDVDTLRQFYSNQVIEIARALMLMCTVLPVLLVLDWRMALVATALLPVLVAFAIIFFSRVRNSFKAMDEAEGAMTTVLQENLTGIRVVRAFCRHDHEIGKFATRNARHRDLHYRLFRLMAVYWSASDFLTFMQMALVLLVGAWRVAGGALSVGTLVAFQAYVGMYVWPMRQMGRVLSEVGKATVSVGRISEILAEKPEQSQSAASEPVRGAIELRNVSFAHAQKQILKGLNLRVQPGETLAILGPSGSGKSTLIHLLLRFYEPTEGSILLDGRAIRGLDRKHVRRQLGVVMQEPFLYSKTLGENVRLGRHDAPENEMVEACQQACIHESIEGFEKRYETLVGERGVTLSGGQRQRVAIARALLREAPILVLDDALSAVDTHTEVLILNALKRRRGRQTTLLIAHRLSTLMQADRIVVLEDGQITQLGTHEELKSQDGLYRRLWMIQGALEDDLRHEMADEATAAA